MRYGFGIGVGRGALRAGYGLGRGVYAVARAGGAWLATTPRPRRRRGGSHRPVETEPVRPFPKPVIHADRWIVFAVLCTGLWFVHGWLLG